MILQKIQNVHKSTDKPAKVPDNLQFTGIQKSKGYVSPSRMPAIFKNLASRNCEKLIPVDLNKINDCKNFALSEAFSNKMIKQFSNQARPRKV